LPGFGLDQPPPHEWVGPWRKESVGGEGGAGQQDNCRDDCKDDWCQPAPHLLKTVAGAERLSEALAFRLEQIVAGQAAGEAQKAAVGNHAV
jgi:hypothetical protein